MATAHNAVGALLLMSVVTVNYYLVTATRSKAQASLKRTTTGWRLEN